MRINCWQFKKCGREPGGTNVRELGICPVATTSAYEGINGGHNAGRYCWRVAGTLCKGEIQGNFAEKHKECEKCDFYQYVKNQEGNNFLSIVTLLKIIEEYNNR